MNRFIRFRWAACAAAAIVAYVMPSAAAHAYRLLGDDPALGITGSVKWPARNVFYEVSSRGLPLLQEAEYRRAIQRGFGVWNAATCEVALLERETTASDAGPSDGANTVQWIDDWTSRGFAAEAIATTDVQLREVGGEWQVVEFDMYFQHGLDWSADASIEASYRVDYVAAHEAGHALAIAHPCGDPGVATCAPADAELMHPIYANRGIELTPDDIDAVCALYGCDTIGPACGDVGCAVTPEIGCPCADDAACREALCVRGRCALNRLPDGDVCDHATDCQSGACGTDGNCASSCLVGNECGPGGACLTQPSGARACVGEVGDFAASCANSDDCVSGLCVVGRGEVQGLCTRTCSGIPCPSGFACVAADGQRVCALAVENSGCAVGGAQVRSGDGNGITAFAVGLSLLMTTVWRRLVSARTRREKSA